MISAEIHLDVLANALLAFAFSSAALALSSSVTSLILRVSKFGDVAGGVVAWLDGEGGFDDVEAESDMVSSAKEPSSTPSL